MKKLLIISSLLLSACVHSENSTVSQDTNNDNNAGTNFLSSKGEKPSSAPSRPKPSVPGGCEPCGNTPEKVYDRPVTNAFR